MFLAINLIYIKEINQGKSPPDSFYPVCGQMPDAALLQPVELARGYDNGVAEHLACCEGNHITPLSKPILTIIYMSKIET